MAAEVWPENTMVAFQAAHDLGFRMMETDVHLTNDGVVVAFHDDELDRVTDGRGRIADLTFAQVAEAKVAGAAPVPRMDELLLGFPDTRFNIDGKSDAVMEPLLDLLDRCDAWDRVCVTTFSDDRNAAARRRGQGRLATGAGPAEVVQWLAATAGDGEIPTGVDVFQVPTVFGDTPIVTTASVASAHAAGIAVHVWTIDDPGEMNRLLDLGVDGIMTDRPDVLRSVQETRGQWEFTGT